MSIYGWLPPLFILILVAVFIAEVVRFKRSHRK